MIALERMRDVVLYIRWRFSRKTFGKPCGKTENSRGKIPLQEMPRLNTGRYRQDEAGSMLCHADAAV